MCESIVRYRTLTGSRGWQFCAPSLAASGMLASWPNYATRVAASCSAISSLQREEFRDQPAPKPKNPQKASAIKKRGQEPMREALYRISGVDLTCIDAIGVETVQVVVSEYGLDLSRFPTEKEFVPDVRLAPHRPMSGGKPVSGGVPAISIAPPRRSRGA